MSEVDWFVANSLKENAFVKAISKSCNEMNFDWFLNQFKAKSIKQSCNKSSKFDFRCKSWSCWSRCRMSVNSLNMFHSESSLKAVELKKSKYVDDADFAISARFRVSRFRCFEIIAHAEKKRRFARQTNVILKCSQNIQMMLISNAEKKSR